MKNINIILVETTHPGNIGASARAMKTMGMESLRLVKPKVFPSADATVRAAGADDILSQALLYETLAEAVGDCKFVYGASTRKRNLQCEVLSPASATEEMQKIMDDNVKIGIVFGRERTGLTNTELDLCNKMIAIPANPDFSSLNLASAVQIICYEVMKISSMNVQSIMTNIPAKEPVERAEIERFYTHLEQCLIDVEFLDPAKPRRLMRRLKQLFNRTGMDQNEYNMMRGVLTAIQEKIKPG
ncbi:MAG: RNA methyltransferase [Gammaproteobacteria bacterium]|nr:RNA methyltransferase [Gammaproteobacteria bacterium]